MTVAQAKALPTKSRQGRRPAPLLVRLERPIGLLAVVLVVGLFLGYLYRSPQFKVQRVVFEGVHMLREEDVRDVAQITNEDSLIFLDRAAVGRRVERLPYVKACEVRWIHPGGVLLRITERKAAVSVMVSNHVFEVDREYVVLRMLSPFASHTGPLITNLPEVGALEPGQHIESEALVMAMDLWERFKASAPAREISLSEISAAQVNDLRMYFTDLPYEIRWGRSDFEEQVRRLEILWHDLQGELPCEQYLDLRFDESLVCK